VRHGVPRIRRDRRTARRLAPRHRCPMSCPSMSYVLCPAAWCLVHASKHQAPRPLHAGCAPASVSMATASSISSCNAAGSDAHDVHLTPVAMSTAMCVWVASPCMHVRPVLSTNNASVTSSVSMMPRHLLGLLVGLLLCLSHVLNDASSMRHLIVTSSVSSSVYRPLPPPLAGR